MSSLLTNETVITQSGDGSMILTNKRIYTDQKGTGNSYYQSIMLEHITSCENVYKSYMWILILSILSFIAGAYLCFMNNMEMGPQVLSLLGVGFVLMLVYLGTRSHVILIASPSTKMFIKVTGMNDEKVREFLGKVEQAIEDKKA